MPIYQIEITETQEKAVLAHIEDIQKFLQHFIENNARKCENRIIRAASKYDPKKLNLEEKKEIMDKITIEPYSKSRQEKVLAERLVYVEEKADVGIS